ncbi:hypothetical protein PsorP6_008659 [Peronosclerospora sorghi]|uniref:Uncharacterized protein n=1 Tax=Peronosclerospora sorghi TaxID=230839 RepID=A0ACC0WC72_9STRA|nr:hypothetical protein PsorP6_008659 [Peronosclerospora sorghi]
MVCSRSANNQLHVTNKNVDNRAKKFKLQLQAVKTAVREQKTDASRLSHKRNHKTIIFVGSQLQH